MLYLHSFLYSSGVGYEAEIYICMCYSSAALIPLHKTRKLRCSQSVLSILTSDIFSVNMVMMTHCHIHPSDRIVLQSEICLGLSYILCFYTDNEFY